MKRHLKYITPLYADLIALFKDCSPLIILVFICSCSSFVPGPEGTPNTSYKVHFNGQDWKPINPDSSDYAFVSTKTKSTIVAQSFCKKFQTSSLEVLTSTMLNGIDDLKTLKKEEVSLSEREGLRTLAQGTIDGVPVFLNLVSVQKDLCLFDFVLISTSLQNLKYDDPAFQDFLKSLSL